MITRTLLSTTLSETEIIEEAEQRIREILNLLQQLRLCNGNSGIADNGDISNGGENHYVEKKKLAANDNGDMERKSLLVNGDDNGGGSVDGPIIKTGSTVPMMNVPFDEPIPILFTFVYSARNFFLTPQINEPFNSQTMNNIYKEAAKKNELKPDNVNVGKYYVYYYDDDGLFYRVKLLSINADVLRILFIDLGDVQDGTKNNLYELLPEFAAHPSPTFACFINDSWDADFHKIDSAVNDFLSDDRELKAKISPPIDGRYPVKILVKNPDGSWVDVTEYKFEGPILDYFVKNKFDHSKFMTEKDVNFDKDLIASGYERLDKLYPLPSLIENCNAIKIMDINNFLVTISENLNNFVTNFSLFHIMAEPKVATKFGDFVAVKSDNFYFRGLVMNASAGKFQILAFDLGCIVSIENDLIFSLAEIFSLSKIPPMTILCAMAGIVPTKNQWSTIAMKQFAGLLRGKFDLKIESNRKGGRQLVDCLSAKKTVSSTLIKWGLARKEN